MDIARGQKFSPSFLAPERLYSSSKGSAQPKWKGGHHRADLVKWPRLPDSDILDKIGNIQSKWYLELCCRIFVLQCLQTMQLLLSYGVFTLSLLPLNPLMFEIAALYILLFPFSFLSHQSFFQMLKGQTGNKLDLSPSIHTFLCVCLQTEW